MARRKKLPSTADKRGLDELGPEWVTAIHDSWVQYYERTVWLLNNDGDPDEIEKNRHGACMAFEAYLDLRISLKKRAKQGS